MKYLTPLLITAITAIFFSCQPTASKTYQQGIKGKVLWLEGNFMPGPEQNKKGEPVARLLYIYEKFKASEVPNEGNFYQPKVEPIKIISSDTNGNFSATLPVGTYSLLSKEEQGYYANLMDGNGYVNPIEVKENVFTEITLKIDYKALY